MVNIYCKENWREALELSRKNYDKTFGECMLRMMSYCTLPGVKETNIYTAYDKHCFYFEIKREDGSLYMNGGIIFHGFPETGYQQNGSVQLDRTWGWSIHT